MMPKCYSCKFCSYMSSLPLCTRAKVSRCVMGDYVDWEPREPKKEEKMLKKIEIVLVAKAKTVGEGDEKKMIPEEVLLEDTRWTTDQLVAEDIKAEEKFLKARGDRKPSEVEVKVFDVPFVTI